MNCAGDVIDRKRGGYEFVSLVIVEIDGARVGEFGEPGAILIEARQ
jgi:hypothetical protein